jgi:hypothetical protein
VGLILIGIARLSRSYIQIKNFLKFKSPLETWQLILHALVASCLQCRQFFASTLPEQLFELKNEDAIKKSENLRDTFPC